MTLIGDGRLISADVCYFGGPGGCMVVSDTPSSPFAPFNDVAVVLDHSASQDSTVTESRIYGSLSAQTGFGSFDSFGSAHSSLIITFDAVLNPTWTYVGTAEIAPGSFMRAALREVTAGVYLFDTGAAGFFVANGSLIDGHR